MIRPLPAVLLALLALTGAAACDETSEPDGSGPTPTATSAPAATPTPTARADDRASVTPTPVTPATATATTSPAASPHATNTPGTGVSGPVFIDDARLLALESFPVRLELQISGALPTPCHRLSWEIHHAGAEIRVKLFSIVDAGQACIQVLKPFDERLALGAFTSGSFTVWLNDDRVGSVDLGQGGGRNDTVPGGDTIVAAPGEAVRLGIGDTLEVTGTKLRVQFVRVSQDSRCPIDVTCIWEGEAILVFSVREAGGDSRDVAVRLAGGRGVAELGASMLVVSELRPEPKSETTIPPAGYEATVAAEPIAPATGSGIAGLVTVGPVCPVMRADLPCPDRPYAGTLVASDAQGAERGRATADADGRYVLALSPGSYRITPLSPPGTPLPRAAPIDVVVPAGWAVVHVAYDSGIR